MLLHDAVYRSYKNLDVNCRKQHRLPAEETRKRARDVKNLDFHPERWKSERDT
jgi:hypothetical protein